MKAKNKERTSILEEGSGGRRRRTTDFSMGLTKFKTLASTSERTRRSFLCVKFFFC